MNVLAKIVTAKLAMTSKKMARLIAASHALMATPIARAAVMAAAVQAKHKNHHMHSLHGY